jgi:hypothetical protein
MCAVMVGYAVVMVSGDVAVVLRMFVAVSSFLMMWGARLIVMLSCGDIVLVVWTNECLFHVLLPIEVV